MEETFRDDQFKGGNSPAREGVMDAANSEVNAVWKQAVMLSLKRSVNASRTIISKDRGELGVQKKEQLIQVEPFESVCRPDPSGHQVFRGGVQPDYLGKTDER